MAFLNGNSDMDTYIDLMAAQLVATGVWSEPDAAFYPAGAHPAKRVITDGTVFVFLQRNVAFGNSNGAGAAVINGTGNGRFNEIQVAFGSGYSLVTHLLTGTQQICGVPLEGWTRTAGQTYTLANDVGSGNKPLQHFTWVDPTGSILGVIVAGLNANTYDFISFFVLERNTTKQYADGFSNLYWHCYASRDAYISSANQNTDSGYFGKLPFDSYTALRDVQNNAVFGAIGGGGNLARPVYFHPFNGAPTFDEPVYIGGGSAQSTFLYAPQTFNGLNGGTGTSFMPGVSGRYPGIEQFFSAYRSVGDSKAYFQFPWYNGNADPVRRSLVAQTQDLWFRCLDTGGGLTDGDIIDYTAPGPVLKRYLVKSLPSQEAAQGGSLNIAIRFA